MTDEQRTAIKIGTDKATVEAAQKAILAILECQFAKEKTKQMGIKALHNLCAVKGATISNCHFELGNQEEKL